MLEPIRDPAVLEGYLHDASNLSGHAEGLWRPRSTAEVAEIVRHCQIHGVGLTVTAARTSTTGGPVPRGGWLLSTEHLNDIEEPIGHDHVTAGAGVFLGELQDRVEATGRFLPPDPTSRHECTLGAAIACNASGARSFRYGPTRPWVEALEVVLPSGEILTARRGDPIPAHWPMPSWREPAVKTAAGYAPPADLVDLFIGQEGTLGIVTRATMRLTDLPPDVFGVLAFFRDRETTLAFVTRARHAARSRPHGALSPRCLEYLDHHCLDIARERGAEVPPGAWCALFCEQEVWSPEAEMQHAEAWYEALIDCGALADDTLFANDEPSRQRLLALRHAIPAGINEVVVRNGMPKIGTDLAVPDDALPAMMDAYATAPLRHVLFGHIGDNHLHLNLLPSTKDELHTARGFYDELARLAVSLGGTVSAEHGIGKAKVKQLGWMVGEETLKAFAALKRSMDPGWILGRGNLVAEADTKA